MLMIPVKFGIAARCIALALAAWACEDQPSAPPQTGPSPGASGGSLGAAVTVQAAAGTTSANAGGLNNGGTGNALAAGGTAGAGGMAGAQSLPTDWFDSSWTQRRKVTISDPALTEELREFQILVRLDAQSIDYARTQTKGEDLRFVTADGAVLKHEIEKWDPVGGSLVWLLLPALSAKPVELWLYFGNSQVLAPTEEDQRAVWPAPYAAVWHLGGNVNDASPSAYAAQNVGGIFSPGMLGQGLKLTRAQKQYVLVSPDGPAPAISGAQGSTFSAWVQPGEIDGSPGDGSDEQDNGSVVFTIGGHSTDNHNSYTGYNVSYEGRMITHVDPADQGTYRRVRSTPSSVKVGEWSFLTYVVDLGAGEVRFYRNGVLVGAVSEGAFNGSTYAQQASLRVVIGSEEDLTKHFWDGVLDELRIEKGMRSASWIAAQYRAMTTPEYATITSQ